MSWLNMLRHLDDYQWDFKIYYYAAKAQQAEQSPYDARTLSKLAHRRINHGYAYPPATLAFFRPFTLASYDVARHLFFVFKTLLVIGLVVLWRKRFVLSSRAGFYALCFLAFNNAIYLDLRAGNVSLVEQALLWAAFWAYLEHRLLPFAGLVLLAASFKLLPILFLSLLLIRLDRRRLGLLVLSTLTFGAFVGVSYLADPELFRAFLDNAGQTNSESKILNPSTYAFSHDLVNSLFGTPDAPPDPALGTWLFAGLALGVAALTAIVIRRVERRETADRDRLEVFLICCAYALIVPRFKDYSYILLIAPAAALLSWCSERLRASPWLIGVLCVPVVNQPMPGLETFGVLILDYYPLFLAALLWLLYLVYASRQAATGALVVPGTLADPLPQ
jgi:hypothetical protein